jgi:hypothetical protein
MTTTADERRSRERVRANLPAHWEGVLESHDGTVVDLSLNGCFILTPDAVQPKELVRLDIKLPTGDSLLLWGEVVYVAEEMGFALRFTGVDDAESKLLEALIDTLRTS